MVSLPPVRDVAHPLISLYHRLCLWTSLLLCQVCQYPGKNSARMSYQSNSKSVPWLSLHFQVINPALPTLINAENLSFATTHNFTFINLNYIILSFFSLPCSSPLPASLSPNILSSLQEYVHCPDPPVWSLLPIWGSSLWPWFHKPLLLSSWKVFLQTPSET